MLVIGVDAATTTGFAVLKRPPGERLQVVEARPILSNAENIRAAVARYRGEAKVAVIEDPYLAKNVKTVKVLARLVGRWEQEFNGSGIEAHLVMADRWQQGLLAGLIAPRSKREVRKRAAVQWVRAEYGLSLDSDSADAVCMATWFARRAHFV